MRGQLQAQSPAVYDSFDLHAPLPASALLSSFCCTVSLPQAEQWAE
jgi:hypothetical protein